MAGTTANKRVIIRRSQGAMRRSRYPSITICPAKRTGDGAALPGCNERDGEQNRGVTFAQQWLQQSVCILNFRYAIVAIFVKNRCCQDQNGRIDKQREVEGNGRINDIVLDGSLYPFGVRVILRDCTSAECRYRLCGITVAPMIPMAMKQGFAIGNAGTKPRTIPLIGFGQEHLTGKCAADDQNEPKINASNFRMPNCIRNNSKNASSTLIPCPR
jgi:hypothetical protein